MNDYTVTPPCGVPGHDRGRWEDDELGIWWCPDCEEEFWLTAPRGREQEVRYARPTSKIPKPSGPQGPFPVGTRMYVAPRGTPTPSTLGANGNPVSVISDGDTVTVTEWKWVATVAPLTRFRRGDDDE